MIERLMNLERPCVEPEYRQLTEQIIQLKQQLAKQLDKEGVRQLEQLTEAYLTQSGILLKREFYEGFCTALDLIQDYLKFTANQQHLPES